MGKLQLGWAIKDISSKEPVNIVGQFHMRISQGIADPLYATALVVDDGSDCAIFLSIDTVIMRCGLLDEIRSAVKAKQPEIPVEKILANATHTHEAPCHYYAEANAPDGSEHIQADVPHPGIEIASSDDYRHFLADQASDAVCEAWNTRCCGGIAYGYGFAVVAHSRRVVYFDDVSLREGAVKNSTHGVNGHAVMYGQTNDDMFSHYEAGADHFLNVMFTFDMEGKLTGAIVNIPCPSQNSENSHKQSADYWGDIRSALKERYGDIYILPQCAAAGDLSPRILHYRKAQSRRFRLKYGCQEELDIPGLGAESELCARRDIAQRVAIGFDEVYDWAKKEIFFDLPVHHDVRTLQLPRRLITEQEYEEDRMGYEEQKNKEYLTEGDPEEILFYNSCLHSARERHRAIINRYEIQKTQPTVPMELHTIRIGNIAFASNRFELYMDYQHRIQARSPFEQTFVVQLTGQPGDEGGTYLCTERGKEGRGYSASRYCNVVDAHGGQVLVEGTLEALKKLAQM